MDDTESKKSLKIFGRDVSEIPCFRNSYLYGISGGIGVGLLTFMGTSRSTFSMNVGFSFFVASTMSYWFWCRYNWSSKEKSYKQLQEALQNKTLYEGTEVEKKLDFKSA